MHTPGPWQQEGTIIAAAGRRPGVICEMSEFGSRYVVHKRLEIGSPSWEEQMANARLIAAAPELADAVRFAVDYLVGAPGGEVSPDYLVNRLVETLRKAGVEREP